MATEVLCYQIDDDEVIADALVQAIKEHDSPELVAVRPFHKTQIGGLWARDNLVTPRELERAKAEGRCYRDDRSTFQWVWHEDGT